MSKKIVVNSVSRVVGTGCPALYDEPCRSRIRQRHWHTVEDEFACILEGEVILVTDAGEETLRAGDCAGFRAGYRHKNGKPYSAE